MNRNIKRILILFIISIGTVAMYNLPYMKSTFYDPMREALSLSHQQLGDLLSIYGIVAMIGYFPGGWLADRFSAKILMSFSLISSGFLGFYFATFPSYTGLIVTFIMWGITTILTFWAAAIKVIRMLGDSSEQGRLYGFYEGFQGVAGTLMSFIGLYIFGRFVEVTAGFKYVVWLYSIISIVCGILIYILIEEKEVNKEEKVEISAFLKVMKMPKVWLIGLVIFSTYMIFSGLTYLNPYLKDEFKVSVGMVSTIAIIRTFAIKLGASPMAGVIADKVNSSVKILTSGFVIVCINIVIYLLTPRNPSFLMVALLNMLVLSILIFGFRGIYYAAVDEANIPIEYTGAVVGFVSLIGFIPDAFFYTLVGGWLDNKGNTGYTYLFLLMLACAILGLLSSFTLKMIIQREKISRNQNNINIS